MILFFVIGIVGVIVFSVMLHRWVEAPKKIIQPNVHNVNQVVLEKKDEEKQVQPKQILPMAKESSEIRKNIVLSDRILIISIAVAFLFILYLFALNNRYEFDGAFIYDKWFKNMETMRDWK